MNKHRRVILAALRDYEYKLDAHYDGHPNAIEERDAARAAIADIESSGATTWEPVEDGLYKVVTVECDISVRNNGERLVVRDDWESLEVYLPDDIRLCRRTTTAQQPDSEATGIRAANVASGIAMAKLREVHESGQDIKIPSLGIVIPGKQNESEATS